ncbi:PREDICTED: uncharacterized protein LOC101291249 [Fragaria vesca subsp. vesca]
MKKYEGNARVKRFQLQALRREFETLEMKVGESVTDYFSRVMSVANRMRTHGQQMDDATVVDKILRSLTEKFNYIAYSIEESKNIDEMSVDELQSLLLVHEQKLNRSRGEEPVALKASTNGGFPARDRGRGVWRGRGRGMRYGNGSGLKHVDQSLDFHGRSGREGFKHEHQSSGRGRGYFDKSKVECFRCHGFGHFRDECNAKLHREKQKTGEQSHFTKKKEDEEATLLMAYLEKEQPEAYTWYLDSGCSNHMCGSKSSFSVLDEEFRTVVRFGDNSTVNVMGKGDIRIRTKANHVETISNVYYVPALKSNLLSIGQLQEKGYVSTMRDGACEVYDPQRGLIAHVKMTPNSCIH